MNDTDRLRQSALDYHRLPVAGKIAVAPTKGLVNQRDLALAYTPGVAIACEAIRDDPAQARDLTARGNLVAVITNGTAVLGLGAIGPLAAKPVMEGKAVLFKKFAGIDVFDIEIDERDPQRLVDIVAALEPTFGGINLEDIKSPECFHVERELRERMRIPVFHDDQHGTAIIVGAAVQNGLRVVGKNIGDVKLVVSGAGAAALACLDLLVSMGIDPERIWVTDIVGVVYEGRTEEMDSFKARYARKTDARSLADVIAGADIFLGLSAAGVLQPHLLAGMAPRPLILALANPYPEIMPDVARAVRPDAVIATGRSDFPNQVNNVLCFPFIFRGALDAGATRITREMELAAVHALAELAHAEQSEIVAMAYGGQEDRFGPEYLIPRPFDPRLIATIAPAVAKAAMASGVATRPIEDLDAYRDRLMQFVWQSGLIMRPVFVAAKQAPKRIAYCEGEDERVLRAAQEVLNEGLARITLIGRPEVIEARIQRLGLRLCSGVDFDLVNPDSDIRYREYWSAYYDLMQRKGVSQDQAKLAMRRRATLIGAMMLRRNEVDAMLCGTVGSYQRHLGVIADVIGRREGICSFATMNLLVLPRRTVFMCDTYVNVDPGAEQIAEMTVLAAEAVRRFGVTPKVALLSHSSFGSSDAASAAKMRAALQILWRIAPDLEVEGEMHGDAALDAALRARIFPGSRLKGEANLLVMPTLDAANIAYNLLRVATGEGVTIGPILLGSAMPAHILTPSATVRRIVNMTALSVVDAGAVRIRSVA
ncbi:MAG: NADP-dependent malic enzyme [Burkholderiales bacterium]|nr:NADP-dependent malic enzyme [Burkholderiales bacterium]